MSKYVRTISGDEWQTLINEQHPILALPKGCADMKAKDTVLFYQKKVKKTGGLIVGAGIVEQVIPVTLNESGRVGPPRALLRFWAERIAHADDVVAGLNELGSMSSRIIRRVPPWIGCGPSRSFSTLRKQGSGQAFIPGPGCPGSRSWNVSKGREPPGKNSRLRAMAVTVWLN